MPNPTPASRVPAKTRRVHADSESIVRRLLTTDATIYTLAAEYGCADGTINNVYRRATTPEQRSEAWRRKQSAIHAGVPTGRKPVAGFTPGVLRGNAARKFVPVGTVVVRQTKRGKKYRWVKVADVVGSGGGNWRPLATVLWEKREGRTVPPGHVIVHDDGDTLNDDPGNLVCVTHQERLRRRMTAEQMERWRTGAGKAAHERAVLRRAAEAIRRQNEINRRAEVGPGAAPDTRAPDGPRAVKDVARERVAAFLSRINAEAA